MSTSPFNWQGQPSQLVASGALRQRKPPTNRRNTAGEKRMGKGELVTAAECVRVPTFLRAERFEPADFESED